MSENKYEALRSDIAKLVETTCCKVSDDNTRVAYSWNIGKVFSESETAFQAYLLNDKLPETLKTMIRFEFNKLKDGIMSSENWEAKRSSISWAITDQIEKRRTDTFALKAITLEEQLHGAQILLDKAALAVSKAKNQESAQKARKRQNKVLKEILFLRDTQAAIAAMANTQSKPEAIPV